MFATQKQINLLRLLQRILKISNDDFNKLSGCDGAGDVEYPVALKLIADWKEKAIAAGKWTERQAVLKYDNLGHRNARFATPIQLRKIDALWATVSRQTTEAERDDALKQFLKNRFKIISIENVQRGDVPRIVTALEAMEGQTALFGGGRV